MDSGGERTEESVNLRGGKESLEEGEGVYGWVRNGVVLFGGERRERRLVVAALMKVATLWWGGLGSVEEAMVNG